MGFDLTSAAFRNSEKLGSGKMRHIRLAALYIKECVRPRFVRSAWVSGKMNFRDLLTKLLARLITTGIEMYLDLYKKKRLGFTWC